MSFSYSEQDEYLLYLAFKGLETRKTGCGQDYLDRLKVEFNVISQMGFSDYYLVVQDFINWARSQEIPVGPGRGSGAGSLVAYLVGITDVDPIRYGLVFERFLNPGRLSMPDFDIDFCMRRRSEVLQYVREKYGVDQVVQIGTKGTMKSRLAVRDTARCLGHDPETVDKFGKLIPEEARGGQGDHKVTLSKCIRPDNKFVRTHTVSLDKFTQTYDADINFQECVNRAAEIEGIPKSTGVHAAGIVIWDRPITTEVPLMRSNDGNLATQWSDKEIEALGLVKYDFLGLRTLTVIADAEKSVKRRLGLELDWEQIPENDIKTYDLLHAGRCLGVFQLTDRGIAEFTRAFKPKSVEDISTISALYRPGPLDNGMVDAILKVRRGEENPSYPIPEIRHILEPTQGVLTYQEQVLEIARVMAGYSLSEADLLRRAIGKKIPSEMEANRKKFTDGSTANGHKLAVASSMYDMIERFADYAFNKSHSIAYSILSFRTAYLKAHYPADFYAACMSSYDDLERIRPFLIAAQREGLQILPPDVDLSHNTFTAIDEKTILFGLSAIKGCGESAIRNVIETRESGPFLGLLDFCHRVNSNTVRLNNVEALALAGAFDKLEPEMNRLEVIDYASQAVQALKKEQALARRNQTSFFDKLFEKRDRGIVITQVKIPADPVQILEQEKEVLGFYVTGHPLQEFELLRASRHFDEIAGLETPELHVTVLGIIRNPIVRKSRRGSKFAFFELEDETGVISCKLWGNVFGQFSDFLEDGKKVIVHAKTNYYRNLELVVNSIVNAGVENNNLRFRYIIPKLSFSLALFLASLPAGPTPLDLEVPGYRYRLGRFSLSSTRSAKLASLGAYKETLR